MQAAGIIAGMTTAQPITAASTAATNDGTAAGITLVEQNCGIWRCSWAGCRDCRFERQPEGCKCRRICRVHSIMPQFNRCATGIQVQPQLLLYP